MTASAERVRALHERLTAQVEALVTGEDWARFLTTAARFHTYSPSNIFLILSQRPDATRVAGYRSWQRLGRQVNRGAKGIAILAPCVSRRRPVDESDPPRTRPSWQCCGASPWSTSSTSPTPRASHWPTSAPPSSRARAPCGRRWRLRWPAGYALSRGHCAPANGRTDFAKRTVVVAEHLSGRQADKTLCHELAHLCLHDPARAAADRDLAEIEAESVAFVVCSALGIDTSAYCRRSSTYVASRTRRCVGRRTRRRVVRRSPTGGRAGVSEGRRW